MKKYLDLTKILKDCPKGMELDCLMYEDVYFDYVDELNIIHCYIQHETHKTALTFNQHGTPNSDIKSKCVIFPKGKTTWEGFVPPCNFKDGDILSYQNKSYKKRTIYIYKYHSKMNTSYYVALSGCPDSNFLINDGRYGALDNYNDTVRFATEEEKKKLFQAIKDNGYNWNEETKTLEKLIVPKFKVGDRITNGKTSITIDYIDNEYYYEIGRNIANRLFFKNQDEWELVPNKFDPKNLKPFDKVLVRYDSENNWYAAFFSHIDDLKSFCYKFVTTAGKSYKQMIPYNEETEHLLGTNNQAPEFYRCLEK